MKNAIKTALILVAVALGVGMPNTRHDEPGARERDRDKTGTSREARPEVASQGQAGEDLAATVKNQAEGMGFEPTTPERGITFSV